MKMSTEHGRNYTDREEPNYWHETLSQCHIVQHKIHIHGIVIGPGPPW